jgi:hypothetical protein
MDTVKGNEVIAVFDGWTHKPTLKGKGKGLWYRLPKGQAAWSSSAFQYHTSWDWLIEACKKWDYLYETEPLLQDRSTAIYQRYLELCEQLDDAVTTYEIETAYEKLLKCVTWYTSITTKV